MGIGADELAGTGYDLYRKGVPGERIGGATGWLTTTAPVSPGEIITLTFMIFDSGDRLWDSIVLIDNFKWQASTTAQPGTG